MKRSELVDLSTEYYRRIGYIRSHFKSFDYSILSKILYIRRPGRGDNDSYNDCIIMLDTETSKKTDCPSVVKDNHVVCFTISIRAFHQNICTLYGHRPSEAVEALEKILEQFKGEKTIVDVHNLPYDWVFLRKFLFRSFGFPVKQLNVKPHYPVSIEFHNGLILRDSLILAQKSLDRWAQDLDVEHKKLKGSWNYDLIRNQSDEFTSEELDYAEYDTLAGVECLDTLMQILNKHVYSMPYTATGIVREECRKRGKEYQAHAKFAKMAPSYEEYEMLLKVFHGGYTHANRHFIDTLITELIEAYDFSSSYPYVLVAYKYPMEKFASTENCSIDFILDNSEEYAYMFKLVLVGNVQLRDEMVAMPALQFSKAVKIVNAVQDNGRVIACDYIEIYLTEQDLAVISEQYTFDKHICTEVKFAKKDYLPRWFTDYIYELYRDKTLLKGGDPAEYSIKKSKANSCYGMTVQKNVKEEILEDYKEDYYYINTCDPREIYDKYVKRNTSILPYQWGVWVTAYAFRNLFILGSAATTWIYSDTDSCYGFGWDYDKVEKYNQSCKDRLLANGYGPVLHNGREYWLGVAEHEGTKDEYTEFKTLGSKRYCGRKVSDGKLHITVAGVPKAGVNCLHDDINNFTKGMLFDGVTTNKKTHTYLYVDEIYIDENGNETGDSVDLSPCDYLLDSIDVFDWDDITHEKYYIQNIGGMLYDAR